MKQEVKFTGKLLDYLDFRMHSNIFLETGTAAGDGVQRALDAGFVYVLSTELGEKWFKMSSEKFSTNKNVTIFNDKSTDFLKVLVSGIARQVIFLDAHPSGPESAGHADWIAKGDGSEFSQENIIKAELQIILGKFPDHTIIIDDVNGMKDGHAQEYMDIIWDANPAYKFSFYDENLSGEPEFYYKNKLLVATTL